MSERDHHKKIIISALAHLDKKVELSNSLNLQDININTEDTFRDLLNIIYTDRKFKNLNTTLEGNFTAIDLGDNLDEIAIQVTSTTDRRKVKETLEKYKTENNYNKVVMLYCKISKPERTKDFSVIIQNAFEFEEWSLKDLLRLIPDSNLDNLKKIADLLYRDIILNIQEDIKPFDTAASDDWDKTEPSDIRDLKEKILAVCSSVHVARTDKYSRDIASGRVELSRHSEREISSMRFRIFEVCQEELIEFIETNSKSELTIDEVKNLIERYTNKAFDIIQDKSTDYAYPLKNKDILRKVVLALIDECYLSFDEEGVYNEK